MGFNAGINITTELEYAWALSIAKLANGNYFATYVDYESDGVFVVSTDLIFRIIDADGVTLVGPTVISAEFYSGTNASNYRAIHLIANDEVMIIYNDGNDSNLVKRIIYDNAGNVSVAVATIDAPNSQGMLGAVALDNGNVFIVYSTAAETIKRIIYDNAGAVAVAAANVATTRTFAPVTGLTKLKNGNVVILYAKEVVAQPTIGQFVIYDPEGDEVVAETDFSTILTGNDPDVANGCTIPIADNNGKFVILAGYSNNDNELTQYTNAGIISAGPISVTTPDEWQLHSAAGWHSGNEYVIVAQSLAGELLQMRYSVDDLTEVEAPTLMAENPGDSDSGSHNVAVVPELNLMQSGRLMFLVSNWQASAFTTFATIIFYAASSPPRGTQFSKRLVAVAGHTVWHETSTPGTMTELAAAAGTLDTADPVAVFEAFQKAYIVNDTRFKVVDFTNDKLSTADLRPTPANDFVPTRGMILTGDGSAAQMVVDYIDAITGPTLVYGFRITDAEFINGENITGTNENSEAVFFVLDADPVLPDPPHYYDWTPFGNDTATYGAMPDRATLATLYSGRGVLAGDREHPHQWYMSRQANLYDWAYASLDAQSAVSGSAADAGEIGDIITALVPYKDDYLLFGGVSTIMRLNGDPAAGGRIIEVSLTTGIYGAASWAFDDQENLYFAGAGGIFVLGPQYGSIPNSLTSERLPDFWSDWALDPKLHTVVMAFDKYNHGIILTRTTLLDGQNKNYWIDVREGGFFQETYPVSCGIYSAYNYDSTTPAFSGLILGAQDSHLKIFDPDATDDTASSGAVAINSHVVIGPALLAEGDDHISIMNYTSITLTSDSDGVYYDIYTHSLAERLIDNIEDGSLNPAVTKYIVPSLKTAKLRQRVSGTYYAFKLHNSRAGETWALESFTIDARASGKF